MMIFDNRRNKVVTFGDLKEGDFFYFKGSLHLKIDGVEEDGEFISAVQLPSGELCVIYSDDEVTPRKDLCIASVDCLKREMIEGDKE